MKHSQARPRLAVTVDGNGLVSHAGTRLLSDMAEDSGLQDDLSEALSPIVRRRRKHDPGRVLVDLAVMAADGGGYSSDLAPLRAQPALFGPVASQPTAWRLLDRVDADLRARIEAARAKTRARVWGAGLAPERFTLDFDATLIDVHTDKEKATPTYKKGFGFHPLLVFLDQTQEAVAGMLREGRAGANTAADHVTLLDQALAQLPVKCKRDDPVKGVDMLVRADSAGATHGFVDAVVARGMEFPIGFDVTVAVCRAILQVAKKAWVEPMHQNMEPREGAQIAEITGHLDLSAWPEGTRAICRREEPHPGAQCTIFEPEGWRHQVFITNSADTDIVYLEARHRGHARVEDRIKGVKALGLDHFPSHDFAANQAWLQTVLIACDLTAWAQTLCLTGPLAKAEPKKLRWALWHTAAKITTSGRRHSLHLDGAWPWAATLKDAYRRLDLLHFAT
ncbi:MAG: IS1380 family transposase [Acidimicrobiales bacterium]